VNVILYDPRTSKKLIFQELSNADFYVLTEKNACSWNKNCTHV